MAVGRRTDTEDLDLDKCNINNDRGKIIINEFLETSESNIYAIGDCVGQIMLAHTAFTMGEIAAENALGHRKFIVQKLVLHAFIRI